MQNSDYVSDGIFQSCLSLFFPETTLIRIQGLCMCLSHIFIEKIWLTARVKTISILRGFIQLNSEYIILYPNYQGVLSHLAYIVTTQFRFLQKTNMGPGGSTSELACRNQYPKENSLAQKLPRSKFQPVRIIIHESVLHGARKIDN